MAAQRGGSSTVLRPKGLRARSEGEEGRVANLKLLDGGGEDEVDIDTLRKTLFSLPLPPPPTHTRTYPTHTALGRIMRLRGLTVNEVAKVPDGPNARVLTDILAGTRQLRAEERAALAVGLGIDGRLLD